MIELEEVRERYLTGFEQMAGDDPGTVPEWLAATRKAAIERFGRLGFPTTRLEDWRYTNVAPIAEATFMRATEVTDARAGREAASGSPLFSVDCVRLVFVNGRYSPQLSAPAANQRGLIVTNLGDAIRSSHWSVRHNLGKHVTYQDDAFVALNTAFLEEGALVEIAEGIVLDKPIHLLFISTKQTRPAVSYPRVLIMVGAGSQATILEEYAGAGDAVYFTNAVTEVTVGPGAVVEHLKLQTESGASFHIATAHFQMERSSSLLSHSISLGGRLVRNNLSVLLVGEGSECTLNGLYAARGRQHIDNHTLIDHATPHCSSRELYKGILGGNSTAVFNGAIVVQRDAQKTDASQSNRNLLLSEDAVINTKPQLEIHADDVKCRHGATIGQVDREAVFYLRSRGIDEDSARRLLIKAFAVEVMESVRSSFIGQPLRQLVADSIESIESL